MIWVFVCLALGSVSMPEPVQGGRRIFFPGPDGFSLQTVVAGEPEVRHWQGRPVSLLATGVVFDRAGQLFWLEYGQSEGKKLPALPGASPEATAPQPPRPNQNSLFCRLPDFDLPGFFVEDAFWFLHNGHWLRVDVPPFVTFLEPQPNMGGSTGLALAFARVIRVDDSLIWFYQPKSGLSRLVKNSGEEVWTGHLDKGLVPVRIGKRYGWLGQVDNRLDLLEFDPRPKSVASTKLDDLSDDSLVFEKETGVWLVTFPSGVRPALASWRTGQLDLKAFFVSLNPAGDLEKHAIGLTDVPLVFQLTTSPGGSPRVGVAPGGRFFNIAGNLALGLAFDGELKLLTPRPGPRISLPFFVEPGKVSLLAFGEKGYFALDENGRLIEFDQPKP